MLSSSELGYGLWEPGREQGRYRGVGDQKDAEHGGTSLMETSPRTALCSSRCLLHAGCDTAHGLRRGRTSPCPHHPFGIAGACYHILPVALPLSRLNKPNSFNFPSSVIFSTKGSFLPSANLLRPLSGCGNGVQPVRSDGSSLWGQDPAWRMGSSPWNWGLACGMGQGPAQGWNRSSEPPCYAVVKPQRKQGELSQPATPRSTHLQCCRLTSVFLAVERDVEGQEHE